VTGDLEPGEAARVGAWRRALGELSALPQVRGGAMVTPDGLVITSSLPAAVPAEPLAALGAALGRELQLGAARLDRGGFRMACFVAEGGTLFVAGSPLGFLLLVGERDADATAVRRNLGEALARLA
jgi:predicted regulator of Ras-like GTPase activity (Roadblock/LC7/MglB family)